MSTTGYRSKSDEKSVRNQSTFRSTAKEMCQGAEIRRKVPNPGEYELFPRFVDEEKYISWKEYDDLKQEFKTKFLYIEDMVMIHLRANSGQFEKSC